MTTETRKPIYCDCCGMQLMGHEYTDGRVVWYIRSHGQRHTKVWDRGAKMLRRDLTNGGKPE